MDIRGQNGRGVIENTNKPTRRENRDRNQASAKACKKRNDEAKARFENKQDAIARRKTAFAHEPRCEKSSSFFHVAIRKPLFLDATVIEPRKQPFRRRAGAPARHRVEQQFRHCAASRGRPGGFWPLTADRPTEHARPGFWPRTAKRTGIDWKRRHH